MRGRLILTGQRLEILTLREVLEVAYAILVEPSVNGSWSGIDEILKSYDTALAQLLPDRESWGEGDVAEEQQQSWAQFEAAARPDPAPSTVAPE